jgi:Domain of unknown function (DUF4383)
MIRRLGMLFGILFMLGGILGFVPGVTTNDMFLGIFMVNTPHGLLHIASGLIFLVFSLSGAGAARAWFLIFGMFYAALSAIGFEVGDGMIAGLIMNNRNDSWGHAGLALAMLLIGVFTPRQAAVNSRN